MPPKPYLIFVLVQMHILLIQSRWLVTSLAQVCLWVFFCTLYGHKASWTNSYPAELETVKKWGIMTKLLYICAYCPDGYVFGRSLSVGSSVHKALLITDLRATVAY